MRQGNTRRTSRRYSSCSLSSLTVAEIFWDYSSYWMPSPPYASSHRVLYLIFSSGLQIVRVPCHANLWVTEFPLFVFITQQIVPLLKSLYLILMGWILFPTGILTDTMIPYSTFVTSMRSYSTFVTSMRCRTVQWKFRERLTKTLILQPHCRNGKKDIQGHESPNPINKSNINPVCTEAGARCA